ncbi:MAG TPA: glycoside hydrolase family 2 TIM barrel-domain containing protein, partial [Propionicimonas sp.]
DGTAIDAVSLRFGCRTMAVDPERGFLLNGEPYPLRGVSRHQDFAQVGNATTDEHLAVDMALLDELGATTVRLAHYQHSQRTYDACDAAGLVVWAEPPVITEYLPEADQNAVDQLTELIVQNRHHASIACWALSNEITVAGTSAGLRELHVRLNDLAHRLDPTRFTTMAHFFGLDPDDGLVSLTDVLSYNLYYGWYVGELGDNDTWLDDFHAAHPRVAIGISEYGADANPSFQTATPTRGDYSEQYQARYHEHLIEMVEARPWLWATHVWNLADFGADGRTEGGLAGLNQKGLVTFDRTLRKDAFFAYKAAWSDVPFVHVCGRRYVDRPEATTQVTVYSNQPEVALLLDGVEVGRRMGRRVFRFDVPLEADHEITARAGEATDTICVRRVATPNPDYAMAVAGISNWFDLDLPVPEGHYSVKDTLADVKASLQGAELLAVVMAQATAHRGDVAQKVEMPESFQRMLDRMTVESLLRQAGPTLDAEHIVALNRALNRIPKIRAN